MIGKLFFERSSHDMWPQRSNKQLPLPKISVAHAYQKRGLIRIHIVNFDFSPPLATTHPNACHRFDIAHLDENCMHFSSETDESGLPLAISVVLPRFM